MGTIARRDPAQIRAEMTLRGDFGFDSLMLLELLVALEAQLGHALDAERLAHSMVEEAKGRASEEGAKIIAAAKAEAEQESMKARETLREQVATLAVKGAEKILLREVNAGVHAELLARLKAEL